MDEPSSGEPAHEERDPSTGNETGRDRRKFVPASLEKGARFGPYEILSTLGTGGMGEVYLAEDARLDRRVALKLVREELAEEPSHRTRFEREARLLASLSHPNIAALFGLEESAGKRALVMELVEGQTLHGRIGSRPLHPREAIRIARQIAEALEAAHGRGILHRDLKPANVKITAEGGVKVLDFGLAKMLEPNSSADSPEDEAALRPTVTATQEGVVVGTAPYMSPEQIRGEPIDVGTDIWAFGCVLYEMIVGRRAFLGNSTSEIAAAILEREPDWTALPAKTPARVARLIRRCLRKDRHRRLQHIGDARAELEDILEGGEEGAVVAPPPRRRLRNALPWTAAGALAGVLITFVVARTFHGTPSTTLSVQATVQGPAGAKVGNLAAISPDGTTLAFFARDVRDDQPRLYVRRFDTATATQVPGSDWLFMGSNGRAFAFSPDSRWIAFVARGLSSQALRLYRWPLDGSAPPAEVTEWPAQGAGVLAWLVDDQLVWLQNRNDGRQQVMRISARGGTVSPPVEVRARGPDVTWQIIGLSPLPDPRRVLTTIGPATAIGVLDLETGEVRPVLQERAWNPTWAATGHLLFSNRGQVLAAPFDPQELRVTGPPVPVATALPDWGLGSDFDVSDTGTLVWADNMFQGIAAPFFGALAAASQDGTHEIWTTEPYRFDGWGGISVAGNRVIATVFNADTSNLEIWTGGVGDPALRPLVVEQDRTSRAGILSADGRFLVYRRETPYGIRKDEGIYLRRADGTGEPAPLWLDAASLPRPVSESGGWPLGLSPDNAWLAFWIGSDTFLLPLKDGSPSGEPLPLRLFVGVEDYVWSCVFSPDGRWIAHVNGDQVYVRRFHPDGTVGSPLHVSPGGGRSARWSRSSGPNSLDLFYLHDQKVWSVSITEGAAPQASHPRLVRDWEGWVGLVPLPDGRLLGLLRKGEEADPSLPPPAIQVVFNWSARLPS